MGNNMKKRILTLFWVACALFTACTCLLCACEPDPAEKLTLGDDVLSNFSAVDLDGNIVDSSVLESYKVTMINVWATWCPPCKEEMPALARLNDENKKDGFQIIGIAYDTADRNFNKVQSAYESALRVVEQTGANYRHLIPSKSLKGILDGIESVPLTVFVNAQGRQIGEAYVGAKSKDAWQKIIDQMLAFVSSTTENQGK